jgi:biotin transport system permease protein
MTLAYAPGDSLAHRLDPRAKLLVQAGFAAAVYATTSPHGLLLATPLAAGCLWAAGGGLDDVRAFRFALPVLGARELPSWTHSRRHGCVRPFDGGS